MASGWFENPISDSTVELQFDCFVVRSFNVSCPPPKLSLINCTLSPEGYNKLVEPDLVTVVISITCVAGTKKGGKGDNCYSQA